MNFGHFRMELTSENCYCFEKFEDERADTRSKSLEKVVPEKLIAEQGVVSEAVARAMVIGIAKKYKSDYAISTTGYLDSNSGDYQIPSGTVFIGIKSPTKITILKTEKKGSRAYLKERTALLALDQVRRLL